MSSNTPRRSILRASALMASGTMVSRILGFVRNAMLIAAVGATAGGVGAAFQTANTLPNTVFNLLASGIFDAVLVPQIVGAIKRRHDGDTYVNRLLTLAGTLLFLVTFATMVLAPVLVMITAAGYTEDIRNLAILFALLCLPQLFFYGLYNLLGELLNAREIFGPYMWAPVVNNVVGIAGLGAFLAIWGGAPDGGIPAGDLRGAQFWVLAGSATLGVICQALCLLWPMRRAGVSFKPDFHFRGTSFGSMPRVAGWTFATLGVSQVGVLSTNNLAAMADGFIGRNGAQGGVVGILAYSTAFMIFMVPQSLITVSLTTAIFTRMAGAVADGDDRAVADNYHLGVRTITSLTLVAAAMLMAGSVPMMEIAMAAKGGDPEAVTGYALVLASLMPGVASTGMVLMSQRVFFAYEDVKPVFLMGIGPTIIQVIVGWSMYALTSALVGCRRCPGRDRVPPDPGHHRGRMGIAREPLRRPLGPAALLRVLPGGGDRRGPRGLWPPVAHGHSHRDFVDPGPHGPGRREALARVRVDRPRVPPGPSLHSPGRIVRHDAATAHPPARAQCCGEHPGSVLRADPRTS